MRHYLLLNFVMILILSGCQLQEAIDKVEHDSPEQTQNNPSNSSPNVPTDEKFDSNPADERCNGCDEFALTAIAPEHYQTFLLTNGATPFISSEEKITVFPTMLAGAEYIQTPDVENEATATNALVFSVLENASGYLAIDVDYAGSADWLEGWEATSYQISTSQRALAVYTKSLKAGHAVATGQWPLVSAVKANYIVLAKYDFNEPAPVEQEDSSSDVTPGSGDVSQPPVVVVPPVVDAPDMAILAPSNYKWGELAEGESVYVDRTYKYIDVPTGYENFKAMLTANSDKLLTNSSHIKFNVDAQTRVYVAVDSRMTVLPGWLSSWTESGDSVRTTDSKLDIFYRDYSTGLVVLGGNEGSVSVSNYVVFLGSKGESGEIDDPADLLPIAANDFVSVNAGEQVVVSVLANDKAILDKPIVVSLASNPSHGRVELIDTQFVYTASPQFDGSDTFDYQVIDADGDRSIATVVVDVTCQNCVVKSLQINLSWSPSSGNPDLYEIYAAESDLQLSRKSSPFRVVPESVRDISLSADEVGTPQSDRLCFRLRARNRAGTSDFSDTACVSL